MRLPASLASCFTSTPGQLRGRRIRPDCCLLSLGVPPRSVPPKTLPTPASIDFPWDHAVWGQGQVGEDLGPHGAWT